MKSTLALIALFVVHSGFSIDDHHGLIRGNVNLFRFDTISIPTQGSARAEYYTKNNNNADERCAHNSRPQLLQQHHIRRDMSSAELEESENYHNLLGTSMPMLLDLYDTNVNLAKRSKAKPPKSTKDPKASKKSKNKKCPKIKPKCFKDLCTESKLTCTDGKWLCQHQPKACADGFSCNLDDGKCTQNTLACRGLPKPFCIRPQDPCMTNTSTCVNDTLWICEVAPMPCKEGFICDAGSCVNAKECNPAQRPVCETPKILCMQSSSQCVNGTWGPCVVTPNCREAEICDTSDGICKKDGCAGPAVECLAPQDNCTLSNTSACVNNTWACVEVPKTCCVGCSDRLKDIINAVSVRVGTTDQLNDPSSAQSRAFAWLVEQCDADQPIDPCDTSLLNLTEQRYALAVMYFSLGGFLWSHGSNPGLDLDAPAGQWMSGLNYCDWGADIDGGDGSSYNQLVCDDFGNVLNLNLQNNYMWGTLPPEIGVLKFMTSFVSSNNYIEGTIPTSLGLITPLRTFDIELNGMDGILFKPEYAGTNGLKEIVDFKAGWNSFTGSIPTEIGLWTKLQNLWLSVNGVSGTIPTEIGNCVDMVSLILYSNRYNIGGTLPTELGNMKALEDLNLFSNKVTGTIPTEIGNCVTLVSFDFSYNEISGTLPTELGNMKALTSVAGSYNQIVGTIPEEIYHDLDLLTIMMEGNHIGGSISDKIGNLTKLRGFVLDYNELTGTIPTTVGNCQALQGFVISHNKISGPLPSEIFSPSLATLSLDLSYNELTGPIPNNYGQLPSLGFLYLNDNFLNGTLPAIAEGEFPSLDGLWIHNNDITGKVDDRLCLLELWWLSADCQPPGSGGLPQIKCSCCRECYE